MESSKLRCNLVVGIGYVPETVFGGHRKFRGIIQSRIKEVAFAMHLKVRDERVPVRYRTPARESMQVHTRKPKGRRNKCCGSFAVRAESFAVHEEFRVKLARAPASKNGL